MCSLQCVQRAMWKLQCVQRAMCATCSLQCVQRRQIRERLGRQVDLARGGVNILGREASQRNLYLT